MNKFYTYAFLREDRTPYYIGKGTGRRIYSTNRTIKPPKDKSRTIFLKQNLTEEESFRHEIYMIAVLGRKDLGTGILINRTNGGEGSSGCVPSEQSRKKISEALKNPSEETRKRMGVSSKKGKANMTPEQRSEAVKKGHASKTSEQRSVAAIKRQASRTIEQRSEAAKKGHASKTPEQRSAAAKKGKANMTPEQRSEASRKSAASKIPEQRSAAAKKGHANMTSEKTMKGKKWWNDGCGNHKRMIKCPGNGWRLGRK